MDIKVPIAVFISSFFYFASVISSNADVYVSDSLGLTLPSLYYAAEAGEIKTIDLNGGEAGIEYEIRLNSSDSTFKDVRFAICNIDELPKYISNQTSNCKIRSFTGETNFNHSVETDKKDVLVIDNRASHFSTKRVYVEMYANVFLTEIQKSEVELGLQNTLNVVHEFFDVKEFDLNLFRFNLGYRLLNRLHRTLHIRTQNQIKNSLLTRLNERQHVLHSALLRLHQTLLTALMLALFAQFLGRSFRLHRNEFVTHMRRI